MKWRWPVMFWHQPRVGHATPEAAAALKHANRALLDSQAVRQQATERVQKADEIASSLEETRRRNHFAEAVARSMQRRRQ